eukprot:gene3334-4179_t
MTTNLKQQFAEARAMLDEVHELVDNNDISKAANLHLRDNEESKRPENLEFLKDIKNRLSDETTRVMSKKEESMRQQQHQQQQQQQQQQTDTLRTSRGPVELPKPPLLQGYLKKQGEKGLVKGYKKRWFQQKDTKLYYYEKEGDTNSYGFINLPDMLGVKTVDAGFELATPSRIYNFQVFKPSDLSYWTEGLKEYKKYYQSLQNNQRLGSVSSTSGVDNDNIRRSVSSTNSPDLNSNNRREEEIRKKFMEQKRMEEERKQKEIQEREDSEKRDAELRRKKQEDEDLAIRMELERKAKLQEELQQRQRERDEEERRRLQIQKQQDEELQKRLQQQQSYTNTSDESKDNSYHSQPTSTSSSTTSTPSIQQPQFQQFSPQQPLSTTSSPTLQSSYTPPQQQQSYSSLAPIQSNSSPTLQSSYTPQLQQSQQYNNSTTTYNSSSPSQLSSTPSQISSPPLQQQPISTTSSTYHEDQQHKNQDSFSNYSSTTSNNSTTTTNNYIQPDLELIKRKIEEDVKTKLLAQQDEILEIERQRRMDVEKELKRVKDILVKTQTEMASNTHSVEIQMRDEEIDRLKKDLIIAEANIMSLEKTKQELSKPAEAFPSEFQWAQEITLRDKKVLTLEHRSRELEETLKLKDNAVSVIKRENEMLREETEKKDKYIRELLEKNRDPKSQPARKGSLDINKLKEAVIAHQSQNVFFLSEINRLETENQLKLDIKSEQMDSMYKSMEESIYHFTRFRELLLGASAQEYCQNLEKEVIDVKKEYFTCLGVSIKLHRGIAGVQSNVDIHTLYDHAIKANVNYKNWPEWISAQLDKANASSSSPIPPPTTTTSNSNINQRN